MARRWFIAGLVMAAVVQGLPLGGAARAAGDPVLIGAGDIASCSQNADSATADLVAKSGGIPFTVGDNAYNSGTPSEFAKCYAPTWGRFKAQTHPVVGDNEYLTAGAAGYFDYFGRAAGAGDTGWYSYDVGAWHIVVLNSNCAEVGGCDKGSRQERWLRADLAATTTPCIAAMWHEPRFSSAYSNSTATKAFWQDLYDYGADIVLNGHHHVYERFAPQDPDGHADSRGIREFIVGTGGMGLVSSFRTVQPNSEVRNNKTHGVLKLTLHPDGYDFAFVPVAGSSFKDSGSGTCGQGSAPPTTQPPPPPPPRPVPDGAVVVAADADARVESAHPQSNYGRSGGLTADDSPATASYLRFNVAGVGPVSRATLRLFVTDKSSNGPEVFAADPGWSERTITWNNRPATAASPVADVGAVSRGQWVDYDVSSAVTGDGQWSFALVGDSGDGTTFSSRDAGSNRPQLVLEPTPPVPPPPPPPPPAPGGDPPPVADPPPSVSDPPAPSNPPGSPSPPDPPSPADAPPPGDVPPDPPTP